MKEVQTFYKLILNNTVVITKPLVPEIRLHLINKSCPWYFQTHVPELKNDPFWAIFWPGGQALTRFVLDNPFIVKKRAVIDIGCGCGALGICSKLCGAKSVICNDIDPITSIVGKLNCDINHAKNIAFSFDNMICSQNILPQENSVIFIGDMFYDEQISLKILDWCIIHYKAGHDIYIGDPGRFGFEVIKKYVTNIATYKINDEECHEFKTASVFKFSI